MKGQKLVSKELMKVYYSTSSGEFSLFVHSKTIFDVLAVNAKSITVRFKNDSLGFVEKPFNTGRIKIKDFSKLEPYKGKV